MDPLSTKVISWKELEFFERNHPIGTIDAQMCGPHNLDNVQATLREVFRVLKKGGTFISITYGSPDTRAPYFEKFSWAITERIVGEEDSKHFVYIMKK